MHDVNKVVIPAPYWGQPGHLGCVRVERFLRWLDAEGFEVVVVRAGSHDRTESTGWGTEITVQDPIGFYGDEPVGTLEAIPLRRKNRLRRWLGYLLLVPDPLVAWAGRAARSRVVLEATRGASWVISSSPPESVHVAATRLADRVRARLMVDMRDGWLDEPTIPLLQMSRLQRLRHARLESRILGRADRVLVTSEQWRWLLTERQTLTAGKTTVITNAYPEKMPVSVASQERASGDPTRPLTLVYAGKLYSSRSERRTEYLLEPIEGGCRQSRSSGRLVFVGNLDEDERADLKSWSERLADTGWAVEVHKPVARGQALELMASADGLLLLSSSMASIPAKLFDYLAVGRPVLAVAPVGSEVWEIGRNLRQVVLVEHPHHGSNDPVRGFLELCRTPKPPFDLPEEFTESHVRNIFLGLMGR